MDNSELIKEAIKSCFKTAAITMAFFLFFVAMFFFVGLMTRHDPLRADENEEFYVVLPEEEIVEVSKEEDKSVVVKKAPIETSGLNIRIVSPVAPVGGAEWTE